MKDLPHAIHEILLKYIFEGACLILYVLFTVTILYGFLFLDSTQSDPLKALQPLRFHTSHSVKLPSYYPMKTLEGQQSLSKHSPFKGVTHC